MIYKSKDFDAEQMHAIEQAQYWLAKLHEYNIGVWMDSENYDLIAVNETGMPDIALSYYGEAPDDGNYEEVDNPDEIFNGISLIDSIGCIPDDDCAVFMKKV